MFIIILLGDQLTEERAVNVIKSLSEGDSNFERLNGLYPKFEDWHCRVNLYVVNFII